MSGIEDELRKRLNKFVNLELNTDTIAAIKRQTTDFLNEQRAKAGVKHEIALEVTDKDGIMTIVPKNRFTACLMRGEIPPDYFIGVIDDFTVS